ncbi:MAG: sensor histidine kinase KdpD [Clostridiales bacterium]|nr:sensor histidine kinase KdpD [Clostridiales bacterium]
MASAFGAEFTAVYVQTPLSEKDSEEDKNRLQENLRIAKEEGADCVTLYGEDVASQIAEFSRVSGVTKIVLGRSIVSHRHFWNKPPLTEQLIEMIPSADIHIIPDTRSEDKRKRLLRFSLKQFLVYPKDLLIMVLVIGMATLIGLLFGVYGIDESTIMAIYVLGVLLIALFTRGYTTSIISSFFSVLAFNFFFTEPKMSLHAYDSRYTVAFTIMLIISIVTGALAAKMKDHAKESARSAYKTKVLFETNQLLQKAKDEEEILNFTATQLMKLLDRDIVIYPSKDGTIDKGLLYSPHPDHSDDALFSSSEREAAQWVFTNHHRAGKMTDRFSDARCLYLSIRMHTHVFGVVGVAIPDKPLDYFENSILLSIVGECALALENLRNEHEKEQTEIRAKNEQLRANFLRTFSHDLRTPLTSISGNAGNLLTNYDKLDPDTLQQMFSDIYDDSQWLISLVENLLSVTRIEDGRMHLNLSTQLLEDVIEEAVRYINRRKKDHEISVEYEDDMLLVKIDAKLIIQVLVNLLDNAIKYTDSGSKIRITAKKQGNFVLVSVADNGKGIPDDIKPKVFDMFFTGSRSISDSRKSLGLGLFLCRSIITAHGGEISVSDNTPQGSIFSFTIPSDEVTINE